MVTSIHYDVDDHISSPMWLPQVAREDKPYVARKTVPSGGTDGPKWPVGGTYAAHEERMLHACGRMRHESRSNTMR